MHAVLISFDPEQPSFPAFISSRLLPPPPHRPLPLPLQPEGDVLIFLTGQEEIEACEEMLKQARNAEGGKQDGGVPWPAVHKWGWGSTTCLSALAATPLASPPACPPAVLACSECAAWPSWWGCVSLAIASQVLPTPTRSRAFRSLSNICSERGAWAAK